MVDLPERPGRPMARGVPPVPPRLPARPTPGARAVQVAANRVVGESSQPWLARTGAPHYLPDLIAAADPAARDADDLWWNWCRMPAGVSIGTDRPRTVAVMPSEARMLPEWLGRDLDPERAHEPLSLAV